jgi:hypothetical protein
MAPLLRLHLWPLRAVWVLLALCATGPASDALDDRSSAVVAVVAAAAWAGWGIALVGLLVPRTRSLTVVRILVPAGAVGAIAAVAAGDELTALDIATILLAAVAVVLALAPWTTDAFVDGSAYGPERRIALRTPLALAVLAVMTWAVMAAAAAAATLFLATGTWGPGIIAALVAVPVAWFGARSIHQLSERWLVLVPTGLVVHDPLVMPEPQLFLRQTMARLGPAEQDVPPDVTTEDLTAGAAGLVLSITTTEPVELLVREGSRGTTLRPVDRVLFSPTLPAVLLAEARQRRLPVA